MSYTFEIGRRVINIGDPRLNRLFLNDPERCASVSEYAAASGIPTDRVLGLLDPYLESGELALEATGSELFVLTAPEGRPLRDGLADVAPNLWERLRENSQKGEAYVLWKFVRGLENAGWVIETQRSRLQFGLPKLRRAPQMGINLGNGHIMPLLVLPNTDALVAPNGLLSEYEQAGAASIGIICDEGALDQTITDVRRWGIQTAQNRGGIGVAVLEGPRFNPTIVFASDASVMPRTEVRRVQQDFMEESETNYKSYKEGPYGV